MKEIDDPTAIQIAGQTVKPRVVSTIQSASQSTGVSFSYLMAQAGKESSFESGAGSRSTSAAGLFQFTKETWLQLIKTRGAAHGLSHFASEIHRTHKGEYWVSDPKLRQQILDLRRDPRLASLMAGEYAKENKAWLEKSLGRPVNSTELYLAHFLGPGGAVKVLKAKAEDPTQPAAELLPQAAHKNRTVFYDHNTSPRSVAAVYERISHAIERPMRQYARLEEHTARSEDGMAAHHHHHHSGHHHHHHEATAIAAAGRSATWPFETGQWPPPYVPAEAVPAPPAETVGPDKVAYTDDSESADQISAPMPPAPGSEVSPDTNNPLGALLKGLFG